LIVEILSLLTALCYSFSSVFILKGMRGSNPHSALLLSTSVQVALLTIFLLADLPEVDWLAVMLFALSGIFASGLGRLFNFIAIERLGVATSSALGGSYPLFSTIIAIMFLREGVAILTFAGVALVVSGVFLVSGGRGEFVRGRALLIPILSAFFYGLSDVVRKMGLNVLSESLLGAQVGATAGMLSFLLYLVLTGSLGEIRVSRVSFAYFSATGVIVSVGWIFTFMAMQIGTVSIVSTLTGTTPLFSVLLSWLMLRGQEDLGKRVILGSMVIVTGISLVTLF